MRQAKGQGDKAMKRLSYEDYIRRENQEVAEEVGL